MIQLRRFLFLLAAVSGVFSNPGPGPKSIGTQAPIVVSNKVIAPDGYSRL